jgi:hypothetical protein
MSARQHTAAARAKRHHDRAMWWAGTAEAHHRDWSDHQCDAATFWALTHEIDACRYATRARLGSERTELYISAASLAEELELWGIVYGLACTGLDGELTAAQETTLMDMVHRSGRILGYVRVDGDV